MSVRWKLLALVLSVAACSADPGAPRPNVLLVTIDTLRADYVHSYGFPASTTPSIDALAARGVSFDLAIAASTATAPSHASIMTSRYARQHSIGTLNGPTRLEGLETLAEAFAGAGYDTAAFVGNVVLKARSGLDRGFALYDDDLPGAELNRPMYFERRAADTGARAVAWLERPRDAPFFLWVHLQDPHGPYDPPPPYDGLVDGLAETIARREPIGRDRDLPVMSGNRGRGGLPHYQAIGDERSPARYAARYAGEIAYADAWVGALVEAAERSRDRGLVVLLTADHGESLDERGFFFQHGHSTTPEQARVPLVVVAPGIEPGRVAGVVSHVDVAPTLLELAGLDPLDGASGISLVPRLRGAAALPRRAVLTDVGSELSAYDDDGYLLVRGMHAGEGDAVRKDDLAWQRFDLDGTRSKGTPETGREVLLPREIVAYLSAEVPTAIAGPMDEADTERLRALGYLPPALPDTGPGSD